LFGGDLARHHILDDRVGPRWAKGDAVELRDADHVAHRVAEPIGVVALEKVGLAHGQRIDGAQVDRHIMARHQRAVAADRQIAVGRAEGPEEIGRQTHARHPAKNAAPRKRNGNFLLQIRCFALAA
jgi:hypothetical protein